MAVIPLLYFSPSSNQRSELLHDHKDIERWSGRCCGYWHCSPIWRCVHLGCLMEGNREASWRQLMSRSSRGVRWVRERQQCYREYCGKYLNRLQAEPTYSTMGFIPGARILSPSAWNSSVTVVEPAAEARGGAYLIGYYRSVRTLAMIRYDLFILPLK